MIDPDVGLLASGGAALLFAAASWHKWSAATQFEAVLRSYRLLPDAAVAPLAWLIPALELGLALGLLSAATRRPSALVGAALLLAYALAIAINLGRRRIDLDCGCAVRHERRPIALWMVIRNLLLAAALAASVAPWGVRPLGAVDALTVGGGVVIAALLYGAIDRLLGQVMPRAALLRGRP
jgi:hypothetical protein